MSFWSTSDGGSAAQSATGEYEAPSTEYEPIPHGTQCVALIDDAAWVGPDTGFATGVEHVKLRWSVLEPLEYEGRKIFQKLFVSDLDPKSKKPVEKRDAALKMLAAIDRNCGGRLAKIAGKPSSEELQAALCNCPQSIRLLIWEMTGSRGDKLRGNWVSAVGRARPGTARPVGAIPQRAAAAPPAFDDDEIPF